MGLCSTCLYLQLFPRHQFLEKHFGRVTRQIAKKIAIFRHSSLFLTMGPIEVTLVADFCLVFDLSRLSRVQTFLYWPECNLNEDH